MSFYSIYAILSRIHFCRDLRFFCVNFKGPNLRLRKFFDKYHLCEHCGRYGGEHDGWHQHQHLMREPKLFWPEAFPACASSKLFEFNQNDIRWMFRFGFSTSNTPQLAAALSPPGWTTRKKTWFVALTSLNILLD